MGIRAVSPPLEVNEKIISHKPKATETLDGEDHQRKGFEPKQLLGRAALAELESAATTSHTSFVSISFRKLAAVGLLGLGRWDPET